MRRAAKFSILLFSVILVAMIGVAETGIYDFIKDHIVVSKSEKISRDADGVAQIVNRRTTSKVTISQTLSEQEARGKDGVLDVVSRSRVTVVTDTKGSVTTIKEAESVIGQGLEVVSIVTNEKTPSGTISTTQTRDKQGKLVITSRRVVSKGSDGITKTTVERPDKDGNLVVREESSSE